MIVAKQSDLALTEFAAFNHGRDYPVMRRWELPFALRECRLPRTASVLDCTINPAGFGERLSSLYAHAAHRHWSPLQKGRFELPLGFPERSFDRVLCINTLEHLLTSQRRDLVEAMAGKLLPGGLLIVTCDYYFDRFWDDPRLQAMGVMRPDRAEICNGWNRVSWNELLGTCEQFGLQPLSGRTDEPSESNPDLYRNTEPYPHACIAGVFSKGVPDLPPPRRVVLGLLTWNTMDVSMDSARAYVEEARMLRRMGQDATVCVCDNGSVDGTAQSLAHFESGADVPVHVIRNSENRGNSVGRNQIVRWMLANGGDYVVLMDGDIEVIPGSTFAMLRHMEDCGHRCGCIGANPYEHSRDRSAATSFLFTLADRVKQAGAAVAWTQYGMFRREIFESGVQFDENGPFGGPGWGYEDNDLAFQMHVRGYVNQRFFGATYLHRDVRSSIRLLNESGTDAAAACAQRRAYLLEKWSGVETIRAGPLVEVRNLQVPTDCPN